MNLITTAKFSKDFENEKSIWVDVLFQDDEQWTPLFTYTSQATADEAAAILRNPETRGQYGVFYRGDSIRNLKSVRVRTVYLTVEILGP